MSTTTGNTFSPAQEAVLRELRNGFQGYLQTLADRIGYAYPTVRRVVQELRRLGFTITSDAGSVYSVTRLVAEPQVLASEQDFDAVPV